MPAQLALFAIVLSIALPLLIDPWLILQLLTHAYVMDPSTFNGALERDGLSTFVRDLPKGRRFDPLSTRWADRPFFSSFTKIRRIELCGGRIVLCGEGKLSCILYQFMPVVI